MWKCATLPFIAVCVTALIQPPLAYHRAQIHHLGKHYGSGRHRVRHSRKDSFTYVKHECPILRQPSNFLIIGHAGGDPKNHCENTLAATRSALNSGANAIEIDVAISKDNVVFLWHDPYPLGLHALARRLGFTLNGRCRPTMEMNSVASELYWDDIKQGWYYDDLTLGGMKSPNRIPSLEEWLNEFSSDPRLRLIWLDVKVQEASEVAAFARSMHSLFQQRRISSQRIQFSAHEEEVGLALQRELLILGLQDYAMQVVVDTVPIAPFIGHASEYDAISKATHVTTLLPGSEEDFSRQVCGCCANIGQPILATDRWMGLQRLVNFNVKQRNSLSQRSGSYVRVYVWTIDDPDHMVWLISAGVDGIITNTPGTLANQIVRRKNFSAT